MTEREWKKFSSGYTVEQLEEMTSEHFKDYEKLEQCESENLDTPEKY